VPHAPGSGVEYVGLRVESVGLEGAWTLHTQYNAQTKCSGGGTWGYRSYLCSATIVHASIHCSVVQV
jgi:hypothetical protein